MRLQSYDETFKASLAPVDGGLASGDKPLYRIHVDHHDVPYVTAQEWADVPAEPDALKQYISAFEDRSPEVTTALARGERIFNLTLDQRFGITVPESELDRWAWFMANAMAIAAGYTSHGIHSRPINRHGPSRI